MIKKQSISINKYYFISYLNHEHVLFIFRLNVIYFNLFYILKWLNKFQYFTSMNRLQIFMHLWINMQKFENNTCNMQKYVKYLK